MLSRMVSSNGTLFRAVARHSIAVRPVHRDTVVQTNEPVHAVIYEWCLDLIEPDHPLYRTSYIGQVVRRGISTAEEAVEARKKEHLSTASRKPKDLGLHWAIQAFGKDAFTVQMLETRPLPREEAIEWANGREVALIAERGGIMQDQEPDQPIRQTFNLTAGGRGDPTAVWQSLDARSAKKWAAAQRYLQAYYDMPGNAHLRVPQSYRSPPDDAYPNGYPLGQTVSNIRKRNDFVSGRPERVEWLEKRGFKMHTRDPTKDAEGWARLRLREPCTGAEQS